MRGLPHSIPLLFLLTKHPLFLRSFGTGTEMGAFGCGKAGGDPSLE